MRRRIAVLTLAAVILGTIAGCAAQKQTGGQTYRIYQLADPQTSAGADAITSVALTLDVAADDSLEERAAAVVTAVLDSGGFWSGIELRDIAIQGSRAYVDLNRRYVGLTGVQLSLADYCITLSLTQLDGIHSVTITAEGQELAYRPEQVLMEQDVLLSTMNDVIETVTVSLYFANADGELAAEQRTLEVYEGQTLAESTIAALLEGPQERELHAIIPEGFQVSSVRVEDRVCTLSLTSASIELLPEETAAQRLILQSIAKTIYSWETVDEIQLLVDGEPQERFGLVPLSEVQFRPEDEPAAQAAEALE